MYFTLVHVSIIVTCEHIFPLVSSHCLHAHATHTHTHTLFGSDRPPAGGIALGERAAPARGATCSSCTCFRSNIARAGSLSVVCACMRESMSTRACTRTRTRTKTRTHTHTHTHTNTHTHTHTHARTRARAHTHTHFWCVNVCVCIHVYGDVIGSTDGLCVGPHECKQECTHDTHTHSHLHTREYIYMQVYS